MIDVITNPQAFFARRDGDLSLVPAVGIVLLIALINVGTGYLTIQVTMSALSASAQGFQTIALVTTVIGGLFGVFVAWLFFGGLFHLLASVLYDGDGSFTDTLAVTGWGTCRRSSAVSSRSA
ncbi:YIP1 family protein [Haloarculaceae archaeon H-GB2-1]|nr:YIP1 family protein [Haloarculaceae archaeon H-GB11]MEA5407106.1 YIP1 family protein [Haloarculaceae archaeon H-GB2-1]